MDIAKLHAEGRGFRTVQGKQPVRILCADKLGANSVVYLVLERSELERTQVCSNDGGGLIEPIPIEREGWVIVDEQRRIGSTVFDSHEDAVWCSVGGGTVARITWQE